MSLRAGVAFVDILPRVSKGFAAEVDRAVKPAAEETGKRASSAFGGVFKAAAAAAGGVFAVGALKDFVGGALSAASDLQESVNVTGLVFKDTRGEIDAFVKTSATALGISEAKARELTAGLGGLLKNMGLSNEETVKWSKSLAVMGADMGSAFNVEPAEAVEAIGSALRGETEPIRRFNVVINEAAIKAEALSLGLAKGAVDEAKVARSRVALEKATAANAEALKKYGADSLEARDAAAKLATAQGALEKSLEGSGVELTNAQKTQATLSLITKQSAAVAGDFANTSDQNANAARIQAAQWENLRAKLGTGLLPVQLAVGKAFAALIPWLEKGIDFAGKFGKLVVDIWNDPDITSNGWVGALEAVVSWLREAFDAAVAFTKTDAFAGFLKTAKEVAGFITQNLKPILAGLFLLFAPLPLIFVAAYLKFEPFRNAVNAFASFVTGTVVPAVVAFAGIVREKIAALVEWWVAVWPQVSEAIGHVMRVIDEIVKFVLRGLTNAWEAFGDDILKVVKGVFGILKAIVETALDLVVGVIRIAIAVINGDWGKAWQAIKDTVGNVWDGIFEVLRGAVSIVSGLIGGIAQAIVSVGSSMWDGIKAGFVAVLDWIIGKWNSLEFTLPEMDLGPLGKLGGWTIGVPDIPTIGARAGGGSAISGRSYLVGEEGPELLRMGGLSGRVFARGDLFDSLAGPASSSSEVVRIDHLEVKGSRDPDYSAKATTRELRNLAFLTTGRRP